MNKLVGILFRLAASVIHFLAGTTVFTLAIDPCVTEGLVEDMPLLIIEIADAMLAAGTPAAIERAAAQQRCQFCQGDAIHLMVHDMVDTLLTIGYLTGQAAVEPLHYLTQKHARLAERVEKGGRRVAKQFLGKHVQHLVGQHGRGEHLIVAQVGDAVEHIGIVCLIRHRTED